MDNKDSVKETSKKEKNWGPGGGMYRGVKASVKTLNRMIVILMISLIAVVIYLSSTSYYATSFQVNGGEEIVDFHCKYGELIDVETPSKTGYSFDGWYVDKDLTKEWNTNKDVVKSSMTLYAKWMPLAIHILFDLNDGQVNNQTIMEAKDLPFHEPYGQLPSPTKIGFTFVGWQYNNEFIKEDSIILMNGEHTLKAIFE